MVRVRDFLVRNMALFVVAAGVLGIIYPPLLTWIKPYIGLMLGVVMFGMGMTLKVSDFAFVLQRPWEVFLGAVLQFTIMPLTAYLLVQVFDVPPEVAAGVILVGTCPGGTASNVISYLAKADVALSVSMTMTTTLLAPLMTPFLTWKLAGAWVDVSWQSMMISIAEMVLLPVVLGLMCNHFFSRQTAKISSWMPLVSVVQIVLLVGGVVALSAKSISAASWLIVLLVVLHNVIGLFAGYVLARICRLQENKMRAVAIEVGMQNSGMAASLAVMYFNPLAALPGAVFSVWHNISGSLLANYFSRKDEPAVNIVEV